MADSRRTRDYQPDAPLELQYLNDPRYTPLDQLGGSGLGGAGNASGLNPSQQELLGGIDQRLTTIQQLGDQRKGLEDQINALPPQLKTSYGLDLSGIKDALSGVGSAIGNGLSALVPSQDTLNNIGMRLQNMGASYTGQTPLYMKQIQQQLDLAQHQDLMSYRRQALQQQLQQVQESRRQHDLGLLERAMSHPRATTVLEQLSQDPQFMFASQAGMLSKGLKDADAGSMQAYREFIPQDIQDRFMSGQLPQHELTAWLDMARENAKVNAKAGAKQLLLKQAMGTPTDQRTPFQQSLVDEHQAEIETKRLKDENTQADTAYKIAHAKQAEAAAANPKQTNSVRDDLSMAHYGVPFKELPPAGPEQQDIMRRYASMYAMGRQEVQQATPATVKERSDVVDRKAFLQSGAMNRPVAGSTNADLAKGDYIQMSDAQQKQAADVDKAGANLKQLFGAVMPMIKAKTPMEAAKQFALLHGGAFAGTNPDAATYKAGSEAFSSQLARVFGGEVGVMTNQDITRWQNTLPTFGDTKQVAERKQKLFFEIYDTAVQAFRNQIAGEKSDTATKKMDSLLKQADSFQGVSPNSKVEVQPQSGSVPMLSSKEEYDKLPSGSLYKKADGKVRRKP